MREGSPPFVDLRVPLALFLCVALFTGCTGLRPSAVVAGEFGPSWQAREAAYLQEEEEDDDFGDRMRTADRKSQTKDVLWVILGVVAGAGFLAYLLQDDEEDDAELTFEDPLSLDVAPQRTGSAPPAWAN